MKRVLKEEHIEIPWGVAMGLWFSILEFSRGVIQVSRKVYPQPPLLGSFLE